MAERVRVREIDDDEGARLPRIVQRGTGSVVTWRRAQMVLLSAARGPSGRESAADDRHRTRQPGDELAGVPPLLDLARTIRQQPGDVHDQVRVRPGWKQR
ncbi:hypothetical protein ACFYOT_34505 [Saccharothrix saharensis]|uniref:hypothetical protein n=1 Tax=Saccharothrix saharensis TaxID=571190 RepID=UPI0036800B74